MFDEWDEQLNGITLVRNAFCFVFKTIGLFTFFARHKNGTSS